MGAILLIFSNILLLFLYEINSSCNEAKDCTRCIRSGVSCVWCKSTIYPYARCDTEEYHVFHGCEEIQYPNRTVNVESVFEGEYYKISPATVTIKIPKGDIAEFTISVTLLKYLPSDTMFILDDSYTMRPVFEQLKSLMKNFSNQIIGSGNSRVGVALYVDKVVFPFADHEAFNLNKLDHPFYFKTVSPLSNNIDMLIKSLDVVVSSTNIDSPEAGFSAIAQSVLCEHIGWIKSPEILKTVVLLTDDISKTAGDGRLAGIFRPFDMKCHANMNGTDILGTAYEYPSLGQVTKVLMDNEINLIISVPQRVRSFYELTTKIMSGVKVHIADLDLENFDLLKIITDSRKALNSNVFLIYETSKNLVTSVYTKCPSSDIFVADLSQCTNVSTTQTVYFDIKLQYLESSGSIKFHVSGTRQIVVNYDQVDECSCLSQPSKNDICKNDGDLICGVCSCKGNWGGQYCDCEKLLPAEAEKSCKNPKTGEICSSNGVCDECGICHCNKEEFNDINNKEEKIYTGDYCECSDSLCENYLNLRCGGSERGKCVCNKCVCQKYYYGNACENKNCSDSELLKNCLASSKEPPCSSHGNCVCGKCECNPGRSGIFCQDTIIPITCSTFYNDVNCLVNERGYRSEYKCGETEYIVKNSISSDNFECSLMDENNCWIYFNYKIAEREKIYYVFVKPLDKKADCPKTINAPFVAGMVFLGIVLVGIILIVIYFILMYFYYKMEYKTFIKESSQAGMGLNNPLYREVSEPPITISNEN